MLDSDRCKLPQASAGPRQSWERLQHTLNLPVSFGSAGQRPGGGDAGQAGPSLGSLPSSRHTLPPNGNICNLNRSLWTECTWGVEGGRQLYAAPPPLPSLALPALSPCSCREEEEKNTISLFKPKQTHSELSIQHASVECRRMSGGRGHCWGWAHQASAGAHCLLLWNQRGPLDSSKPRFSISSPPCQALKTADRGRGWRGQDQMRGVRGAKCTRSRFFPAEEGQLGVYLAVFPNSQRLREGANGAHSVHRGSGC